MSVGEGPESGGVLAARTGRVGPGLRTRAPESEDRDKLYYRINRKTGRVETNFLDLERS